ncbi:MAG: hemerythrin family protein [candidate division Zixibacteria bacterium]|nr:hemerythrin family protein [candidate division Zixibacteria bacterium]
MQVKFTDDLLTGHEEIDNQHKELIKRLDYFWRAAREGESKNEVIPALLFLGKYVVEHFTDEERFQQEIGYPGHKEHKIQHEEFKAEVDSLVKRVLKMGPDHSIAVETLNLILEWVVKHIKESDKKMVQFARAKDKPVSTKTP